MLAVDPVLEILLGRCGDALFCFREQVDALPENYSPGWAGRCTGWLHTLFESLVITELALHNLRVPVFPLKLRNLEGTRYLAVSATNAQRTIPGHCAQVALYQ